MLYVISCPYSQVNNEYEDGRFRRARAASRRTRGYINLAIITGLITIVIVILAVLQLFEVIDLDSNDNTNGTTTSVGTTGGNGYYSDGYYPYNDDDNDDYNIDNYYYNYK